MHGAVVRVVGREDVAAAAAVLAVGFDQEPAKAALVPDASVRRVVLELSALNRLHDATRRGTAHMALVDDAPGGVAVWVPPGVPEVSLSGAARAGAQLLGSLPRLAPALPHLARALAGDVGGLTRLVRGRRRAVARAARGPTWNLVLIATLPEHRGKGLARALLDRQLRRCDEDAASVWLETTDPVNLPIYERFGFEVVGHVDGPAWIPGLWVMRREPRPPRA